MNRSVTVLEAGTRNGSKAKAQVDTTEEIKEKKKEQQKSNF